MESSSIQAKRLSSLLTSNKRDAVSPSMQVIHRAQRSLTDIKISRRDLDLSTLSAALSRPKIACSKHGHQKTTEDDGMTRIYDIEHFGMLDRHKSNRSIHRQNRLTQSNRSLTNSLRSSVKPNASLSYPRVLLGKSDFIAEKEESKYKGDNYEDEVPQRSFNKSRMIGLVPAQPNPLDLNPTRKDKVVIKFSDIYKMMGERPISTEKHDNKRNSIMRKKVDKPLVNKFDIQNLMQGIGNFAERRFKIPKVTSVIETIRKNSNHMLCRVSRALQGYRNIDELHVTLEGQKPHLSSLFINRLGGQFHKTQLDLIYDFFFDRKSMIKPTVQLSASSMIREMFKSKDHEILMDVERKQIAYLDEKINTDPFSLEVVVELYFSKHFEHIDEQLNLFSQATEMFLRLVTEAKSLYFGYLSEKCNNQLKMHLDKTTTLKYLTSQSDLKTFATIRAGMDDQSIFMAGIKRGLGFDWVKGRGIERGGDMGNRITKEEKMFNKRLNTILEDMRSICK